MFTVKKMSTGLTAPFEYLPVKAGETIAAGEALVLASGKLTKCAATAKPAYVSMGPADSNGVVPVVRVLPHIEFATTLAAAGASLTPGSKVTLHTDGGQVTATTTDGVFTVLRLDGTAIGDTVTGVFE